MTSRRPFLALVVAVLALVVATGSTSYAAGLARNSVGTQHLKNNAVVAAKINNGAVTAPKLANGAVTGPRLATGAVTGAKVGDGALTGADVADGSIGRADPAPGARTPQTTTVSRSVAAGETADLLTVGAVALRLTCSSLGTSSIDLTSVGEVNAVRVIGSRVVYSSSGTTSTVPMYSTGSQSVYVTVSPPTGGFAVGVFDGVVTGSGGSAEVRMGIQSDGDGAPGCQVDVSSTPLP